MSIADTRHGALESYLQRLRAALRPLPEDERRSIVSEIDSHLAERVQVDGSNISEVLRGLGEPEELARAYVEQNDLAASLNRSSPVPLFMSVLGRSGRSAMAFAGSFVGAILYLISMSLLLVAVMKPVAPAHVGLWVGARQVRFGFLASPPAFRETLGFWIIPIAVAGTIVFYLLGTAIIKRCGTWLLRRDVASTRN